jgi:iron complex transport system substrate-binding protein
MMDHAGPAVSDEALFGNAAIDQTPAGAARKVIRMDGGYLLGFGPRTAGAISDLAEALYGDKSAN